MFRLRHAFPILAKLAIEARGDLKAGSSLDDFNGAIRKRINAKYRGPWADMLIAMLEHLPEIAEFIATLFELFSMEMTPQTGDVN